MTVREEASILKEFGIHNLYDVVQQTGCWAIGYQHSRVCVPGNRRVYVPRVGELPLCRFKHFWLRDSLDEVFAWAIKASGIPREQWRPLPFSRFDYVPRAAIRELVNRALESKADSPKKAK